MNAVIERDVPPQAMVPVTPMTLLSLAMEKGTDVEQLRALMDLQERWERNDARKQFAEAMVLFKSKPIEIRKNKRVSYATKTGGRTDYTHATLDAVCDQIISRLAEVGISHKWTPEQQGNKIKVTCVLTHRAGHSESTVLEANADDSGGKNAIQAVGSAVHYLERYTVLAATGLTVKDQDDDGVKSGPRRADPETVYRVEPTIDGPTPRTPAPTEEAPSPRPADTRLMNEGQRRILLAKLKNAGLSDTDVQGKFGKPLGHASWLFTDYEAIQAWIGARTTQG